jgi:hypothetical protein
LIDLILRILIIQYVDKSFTGASINWDILSCKKRDLKARKLKEVSSVEKSHEQKEKENENEMEMEMKVRSWTRRHSQQSSKGEIGR